MKCACTEFIHLVIAVWYYSSKPPAHWFNHLQSSHKIMTQREVSTTWCHWVSDGCDIKWNISNNNQQQPFNKSTSTENYIWMICFLFIIEYQYKNNCAKTNKNKKNYHIRCTSHQLRQFRALLLQLLPLSFIPFLFCYILTTVFVLKQSVTHCSVCLKSELNIYPFRFFFNHHTVVSFIVCEIIWNSEFLQILLPLKATSSHALIDRNGHLARPDDKTALIQNYQDNHAQLFLWLRLQQSLQSQWRK